MAAWQSNPGGQDPIPRIRHSDRSLDFLHDYVSFQMIVVGNTPRQAIAQAM